MDRGRIESIIQQLEDVRARTPAYVGDEFPAIVAFLDGFNLACRLCDNTTESLAVDDDILIQHGWHPSSLAPLEEMQERGLSPSEMAYELLTMTIAQWKKRLLTPTG